MIFKSISPSPALQEFVRNYTLLQLKFSPGEPVPYKYRPPKPEQGIVFYVKGYVDLLNTLTGSQQVPATVSVFTHQTERKIFQVSPEFFMFSVFLPPGILHRLISIPSMDLKQDYHDAELFFGQSKININVSASPFLLRTFSRLVL